MNVVYKMHKYAYQGKILSLQVTILFSCYYCEREDNVFSDIIRHLLEHENYIISCKHVQSEIMLNCFILKRLSQVFSNHYVSNM